MDGEDAPVAHSFSILTFSNRKKIYELPWVLLLYEQQGIAAHQTAPHTIRARFNVLGLGGGGGKRTPTVPPMMPPTLYILELPQKSEQFILV